MALDPSASEGHGPRFSIITKALAGGLDPDGKRRFKATASSTIVDHAGDEIQLSALEGLAEQFRRGVGVFMDHDRSTGSAFGVTDGAEIIQRGMDAKGTPIWDLDITGIVNTPSPRATQLADSIDGGFVKLGASVTAFVRKHLRKREGGMLIAALEAVEVSIVGVPENQRSWAHKAAVAVKSFGGATKDQEETMSEERTAPVEPSSEVGDVDAGDTPDEAVPSEVTPETPDKAPEAPAEPVEKSITTPGNPAADAAAVSIPGVQESAQETPETASDDSPSGAADPQIEKAYEPGEVRELVGQVTNLVTEIGRLREEIVQKDAKIAAYEAQAGALTTEVDEARQVITKVLGMPLRPQTAGYVEELVTNHSLFAATPEIAEYLNKRSKLSHE